MLDTEATTVVLDIKVSTAFDVTTDILVTTSRFVLNSLVWKFKDGYTLVTLPRIVTPYRDSVDGTRDRVTYQKLVTR
jgi:hypothetical protein